MNSDDGLPQGAPGDEIPELIATLLATERRLMELTAGEVDTVTDGDGTPFLLRRPQLQLREHEAARQLAILDALPAHIALLDAQGNVLNVNKAWRQSAIDHALIPRVGEAASVNYLNICDTIGGKSSASAEGIAAGIRAVLGGQLKTLSMEYPCHCAQAEHWFLLMVTPVPEDNPTGAVVMHLDVTQRKEAEDAVRSLNQNLEARVTERTAQLAFANKELEAFSYSVSHDLRAPLRHIIAFAALLTEGLGQTLAGEDLRRLLAIEASAQQMNTLINDLLAFARLGNARLRKVDVDLGELALDAKRDFQLDTQGRDIAWNIRPMPAVQGDRALLRMVMVNLISNAVKFSRGRARATIEIGCLHEEVDHEPVFYVKDNGAGFDDRHASKLFGVFERLHSQDEYPGIGIGLANVQRIVHRHGGRIWAKGQAGEGATFYLTIPHSHTEVAAGATTAA